MPNGYVPLYDVLRSKSLVGAFVLLQLKSRLALTLIVRSIGFDPVMTPTFTQPSVRCLVHVETRKR